MAPQPDPHTELGLPPTATQAEIRHAFRRRLLEHHPDTREQRGEGAAQSDQALQRTLEAYEALRGYPQAAHVRRAGPHRAVTRQESGRRLRLRGRQGGRSCG